MFDFASLTQNLPQALVLDELTLSGHRVAAIRARVDALRVRFDRTRTLLDQVSLAAHLTEAQQCLAIAEAEDNQLRQWVAARALSGF
jgi:hypothetical protein